MEEKAVREVIEKVVDTVTLKHVFPVEKRKTVMARMLMIVFAVAWLPILMLLYSLAYQVLFHPIIKVPFTDVVLLGFVFISAVLTMVALKSRWPKFSQWVASLVTKYSEKS